ncbi:MAG: GLUG motif-containing protein [Eubacteriales bacterium]|nr:GLUG motif-containing protein [Eubacteriales bacterium]
MKKRFTHLKKITSLLIIFILIMTSSLTHVMGAAWTGNIASSFGGGSGTSISPYIISTPEQLAYLARLVNDNNASYNASHYSLTADIDLGGMEWTPIGKGSWTTDLDSISNYSFKGVFNGNGHTVSNFKITNATSSFVGLFGNVQGGNSGKISNLNVSNFTINITSNSAYNIGAGGLMGACIAIIESCGVSNGIVNVTTTGSANSTVYAGGLLGRNQGGAFTNCYARVSVSTNTGGTSCHSYAGGFVGHNTNGTITASYSTGNASAISTNTTSAAYAGGFTSTNQGTITNCYANGNATSRSDKSTAMAAGFAGYNTGEINTCYATGNTNTNSVTKTGYGGGLTGNSITGGALRNSFATGNVTVSGITNAYAGGLSGLSGGTVERCYRSNSQSITGKTIGTYGTSTALNNLSNKTFISTYIYGFNFTSTWTIGVSGPYIYPTLLSNSHPVSWSGFNGGDGSSASPYEIANADQLKYLRDNVNNGFNFQNTYFKLTGNIDLSGAEWTPIGKGISTITTSTGANAFAGNFDGGNYVISNFVITSAQTAYTGLFGNLYGGSIKNLNVIDFNINVTAPSGSMGSAGGLVGTNTGTIANCYAKGSITSKASSTSSYVGGLVGSVEKGSVSDSIADVKVTSTTTVANCHAIAGGLVGYNKAGTITQAYATGAVESYSSGTQSAAYAGGFVGQNTSEGTISDCYATGAVSSTSDNSTAMTGGFVAHNVGAISTSYSTGNVSCISSTKSGYGGVFVGNTTGTIKSSFTTGNVTLTAATKYVGNFAGTSTGTNTNCYYSSSQSVTPPPTTSYGISTSQSNFTTQTFFTSSSNFATRWDFTNMWQLGAISGYSYPTLKYTYLEITPSEPEEDDDPDIDPAGWDGTAAKVFAGGNGSESDPYQVADAPQLLLLGNMINEGNVNYLGKHYILTDDIDLNARHWTPIGKGASNSPTTGEIAFTGHFNGNGYTINNFKIKKSTNGFSGLFGVVYDGSVSNVTISNAKIEFTHNASYPLYIGAIAGYSTSPIKDCTVNGAINITNTSLATYAGGIVGYQTGEIERCSTNINLTSKSIGNSYVGGLVGYMKETATATNCYTRGITTSESTGSMAYAGGLSGYNTGTWFNSYAVGDATATSQTSNSGAGGLFGYSKNVLTSCFATGNVTANADNGIGNAGGIIGEYAGGALNNCYRCTSQEVDGTNVNTRGTNTAIDNLKSKAYLTSSVYFIQPWDFDTVWQINSASGYSFPTHKSSGSSPDVWEGDIATEFAGGSGTSARPYTIANASQLAYLAYMVNTGTDFSGTYFILTNNIDLSQAPWVPIGKGSNATLDSIPQDKAFAGVFDGKGFSIKNMTISAPQKVAYGLFGIANSATISNIKLIDYKIILTPPATADVYAGGIAGATSGSITNCYTKGIIDITDAKKNVYAGGIVGINKAGTILSARTVGNIKATVSGKGYAGVGGVAGKVDNGIINGSFSSASTNATNTGSEGKAISGGLVGELTKGEIVDSYFSGIIAKAITMGNISAYSGGLAGYAIDSSKITTSYSAGEITASSYIANSYAGGIVGYGDKSSITSAVSMGNVTSTSESGNALAGGIISNEGTNTITKCYKNNQQIITGIVDNAGTATPPTQFPNETFYTNTILFTTPWNFTSTWEIKDGAEYTYPTLISAPHITPDGIGDIGGGEVDDGYTITYNNGIITVNSPENVNSAILIVAAYNGNVLKDTEIQSINIVTGDNLYFTTNFSSESAEKIKVMIWNNAADMSEISKSHEFLVQ